jgi:hypothetical protein
VVADFAVAGLRVDRGFGAAVPVSADAAALAVAGFRVVRRFGAVPSVSGAVVTSGVVGVSVDGDAGFWATWARNIASSSGGTSLQGSLDERGTGSGRSSRLRSRVRSSRGALVRPRPLTSGYRLMPPPPPRPYRSRSMADW